MPPDTTPATAAPAATADTDDGVENEPRAQTLLGDLCAENRSDLIAYAAGAAADQLVVSWLDWTHEDPTVTGQALARDVDNVIALLTNWRSALASGRILIPAAEPGPYPSEVRGARR